MLVKQFSTGGDRNFGYIAVDEDSAKAVVIDPSFSPETIVNFARQHGYKIEYIFITHNHPDHTNGNEAIETLTGKRALLFRQINPTSGVRVEDNATFPLGRLKVTILHTPGHTPDSICIQIGDALFTGDTLFVGKVGGTASTAAARTEYTSLHSKLLSLPDETRVFPGHDYGTAPQSTIGAQRRENPFLIAPDFAAFLHLKENWVDYKKEHGIE
ncbi:TPA: MBL fold metallo-hydrolase [Candidatus Acetothermia bacterium]|nr:MBL fold metallo-hydrolase [Candidatus Acetothermia bacterium]